VKRILSRILHVSKRLGQKIWHSRIVRLIWLLISVGIILLVVSIIDIRMRCGLDAGMSSALPIATTSESVKNIQDNLKDYHRDEESSYLTFPEWYIVYSAHEYADTLRDKKPSSFPYLAASRQFWCSYNKVFEYTQENYAFNGGRHFMISVIGVSFTAENIVKGIYENSIGWITELVSGLSEEDVYAQRVADDYAQFLHQIPWYEYPFGSKLTGLWKENSLFGKNVIRKWERKAFLTAEYSVKAVYAKIIKRGTRATYEPAPLQIMMRVKNFPNEITILEPRIKYIQQIDTDAHIIEIPRYEEFTSIVLMMAHSSVEFQDIAGNDAIFISVIADRNWTYENQGVVKVFEMKVLTQPATKRVGLSIPISQLSNIISDIEASTAKVEHFYDY
jgi:hypothetical protein